MVKRKSKSKTKTKPKPKFKELPPVTDAAIVAAARQFAANLKRTTAIPPPARPGIGHNMPPPDDTAPTMVVAEDQYAADSIKSFCRRYRISEELFHKLQRQGKGPQVIRVGRRVLITGEAGRQWRDALAASQQAAE